jgi:acylphosphatase
MGNSNQRLHVSVSGIVQGVGFRFFVYQYGVNLDLRGWVRNRYNGEVEVTAEGSKEILDKFLELIKEGPQSAQVEDVNVEWLTASGEFPDFTILPSA